jgi:SAM-dependent methyltransferase
MTHASASHAAAKTDYCPLVHQTHSAAAWVTTHADLVPRAGRALDVACGRGRHALWLAERGLTVRAVDRDPARIAGLQAAAAARALPVTAEVKDLEAGAVALGRDAYDVIVVVHYLHRPLFPALLEALKPGGVLIYETFTRAQAARGKPSNPDFLLEPGELNRLVAPLTILDAREGAFEDRDVASIVARRPA